MKALLIGGTGTISTAVTRLLMQKGWDIYLLNRGHRNDILPDSIHWLNADVRDENSLRSAIGDACFDVVCDFIGFVPEHVEQDIRVFNGRCGQFIYISSASAYHKPVAHYKITEGTTLSNPFWKYSRDKIACEQLLRQALEDSGFPVTIVRPSHTYDERTVPVAVHGNQGPWQVLARILHDQPIIIHGDGSSLWTVTHNSDFAKAFVGLMGNPKAIGEAFHITSDESLTWNQIMEMTAHALGRELHACYVPASVLAEAPQYDFRGSLLGDKACSVVFDNTKVKSLVPDFVCTTPFCKGVQMSVDFILSHPELQRPDPEFDAFSDRLVNAMASVRTAL